MRTSSPTFISCDQKFKQNTSRIRPPSRVGKDHFENDLKSKSHIWKLISNQNQNHILGIDFKSKSVIKIKIIKFHKDKQWHNKKSDKGAH